MESKISIVTMTHNGRSWLDRCLSSFYGLFSGFNFYEWIIFDCGSSDGTKDLPYLKNKEIKFFEMNNNDKSFSDVNNEMARIAEGDRLLFLNNDIKFLDLESILNMSNLLLKNYNIGCVGAKLLYPDYSIQHGGVIFRKNGLPWHVRGEKYSEKYYSYNRKYQAVTAACMMCKTKDFWDVGGFDNRYYFCFEDVDLCFKMKRVLNKDSVFCAGTKFIHDESRTILMLDNKKQRFVEAAKLLKGKWANFIDVDEHKYINNLEYNICEA